MPLMQWTGMSMLHWEQTLPAAVQPMFDFRKVAPERWSRSVRMTISLDFSPHLLTFCLDQAGADSAEEVFGVGFSLRQDFGLVAVFEGYFLEEEFDGVFGFEALGD